MKFFSHVLHAASVVSLVSGIGITAVKAPLYATLASPDAAATYAQANAAAQFSLGILLVLLGLVLHAYVRAREDRRVHITVKPKKKSSWIWMEMRV